MATPEQLRPTSYIAMSGHDTGKPASGEPQGHRFTESDCLVLEAIIAQRRDVRGHRFTDEPLPPAIVERIIDAGLRAPSVGFSQPWHFVVVRDPRIKAAVRNSFEQANEAGATQFDGERQRRCPARQKPPRDDPLRVFGHRWQHARDRGAAQSGRSTACAG